MYSLGILAAHPLWLDDGRRFNVYPSNFDVLVFAQSSYAQMLCLAEDTCHSQYPVLEWLECTIMSSVSGAPKGTQRCAPLLWLGLAQLPVPLDLLKLHEMCDLNLTVGERHVHSACLYRLWLNG
jgi:hypothetical protein